MRGGRRAACPRRPRIGHTASRPAGQRFPAAVSPTTIGPMSTDRIVWTMCAAQVAAQIGAFAVAALLPVLIETWGLTNTQAGWLSGIYYVGYTLAVPVLSSLTDRVDARRIYVASTALTAVAFAGFAFAADGFWSGAVFRTLMGIGWAGTYMPGLKALS